MSGKLTMSVRYLDNLRFHFLSLAQAARYGFCNLETHIDNGISDAVSTQHWAKKSKRSIEEASNALKLLQDLFQQCAQPRKSLLVGESLLERRVGLLKHHADRQAAHISLDAFLFGLIDIVHVVAAIKIVGSIIVDFDQPQLSASYFDEIDKGSWSAAKATFPDMAIERLFLRFDIHQQAKNYWKLPGHEGLRMLLNQLPSAIGYWDSQDEAAEAPAFR